MSPARWINPGGESLCHSNTQLISQIHALLRQLLAGGAPASLTAAAATALLRGLRAKSAADRMRVGLCRDLIADIRRLNDRLATNEKQMAETLDEQRTRLREVDGIGAVTATRLIGRTGRPDRFLNATAYARTARRREQIASADTTGHRLSRCGDRQLNQRALYHRCGPDPDARKRRAPITIRRSPRAGARRSYARLNVTCLIMSGASCCPTKSVVDQR